MDKTLFVPPMPVSPTSRLGTSVSGYRPELDAIRFIAFFLVYLHHILPRTAKPSDASVTAGLISHGGRQILISITNACGAGLCLFFCLSAYLITELLLRERENSGGISVRRFYVRRVLRIWPLYFLGILIGITLAWTKHLSEGASPFVWYLFFAGNFYCAAFGFPQLNPMTPLWSISIEEQFYLVWPWAMHLLSRRGLAVCALCFIVSSNITLFALGQHHASTETTVWCNTLVQFEMFGTGILLALLKKPVVQGRAKTGLLLALSGPVMWFAACYVCKAKQLAAEGLAVNGLSLMIGYLLFSVGCAAVLWGICLIGPNHIPKWLANLGKISYGLYVYHVLAVDLAIAGLNRLHLPSSKIFAAPLALLLTIIMAKISYAWLETPFLRLKRRFEVIHSRPI